jgi:hypothetical protein
MAVVITKAKRSQAKVRIGIMGPSGGGKTVGTLLMGYGLMKATYPGLPDEAIWEKIGHIDTERSSAELVVGQEFHGTRIGSFYHTNIEAPFTVQKYLAAIDAMEKQGVEYLIIDSLSHVWAGEGGAVEKAGMIGQRTGNTWSAWREVSPDNNRLIEKILQGPLHMVVTLRTKTEWVVEKDDRGKQVPKAVGLKPIFKDDIEYEMTIMFDVDKSHTANASKDRTHLFDGQYFTITPKTGVALYDWLASAEAPEPNVVQVKIPEVTQEENLTLAQQVDKLIRAKMSNLVPAQRKLFADLVAEVTGGEVNYRKVTDEKTLKKLKVLFSMSDTDTDAYIEQPDMRDEILDGLIDQE